MNETIRTEENHRMLRAVAGTAPSLYSPKAKGKRGNLAVKSHLELDFPVLLCYTRSVGFIFCIGTLPSQGPQPDIINPGIEDLVLFTVVSAQN